MNIDELNAALKAIEVDPLQADQHLQRISRNFGHLLARGEEAAKEVRLFASVIACTRGSLERMGEERIQDQLTNLLHLLRAWADATEETIRQSRIRDEILMRDDVRGIVQILHENPAMFSQLLKTSGMAEEELNSILSELTINGVVEGVRNRDTNGVCWGLTLLGESLIDTEVPR